MSDNYLKIIAVAAVIIAVFYAGPKLVSWYRTYSANKTKPK
jgi:hypothetical protein